MKWSFDTTTGTVEKTSLGSDTKRKDDIILPFYQIYFNLRVLVEAVVHRCNDREFMKIRKAALEDTKTIANLNGIYFHEAGRD